MKLPLKTKEVMKMKNEIVNGKKIKAVYYVVNYDGDEYRDGKAVIPSCEVTVENLVKYGERAHPRYRGR